MLFLTPTSNNTASAPPLAVTHLGANWSQGARDSTRLAGARDSLGLAPGQAKEGQGGLPALLAQRQWPDSNVAPQNPLLLLLLTSFWALVARRHNMRLCYNSVTQILENSFSSNYSRQSVC